MFLGNINSRVLEDYKDGSRTALQLQVYGKPKGVLLSYHSIMATFFFKDSHKYIHPFLHNYTIVGLKSNNYLGYIVIHHGVFQLSHRAVDNCDVMRCSTESDIRTIS